MVVVHIGKNSPVSRNGDRMDADERERAALEAARPIDRTKLSPTSQQVHSVYYTL